MKVGVIAVQGAVSEHIDHLKRAMKEKEINGQVCPVRIAKDLADVSGIVIPGGESTTISKLMLATGMHERIIELANEGLPILGTCAGTILLAKQGDGQVKQTNTKLLGLMEIGVARNAYGRQVDSFEVDLKIPEIGNDPFRAVFIRAPTIREVWGDTRAWVRHQSAIVGAKKGNILALTFHPELSDDYRVHQYFLKIIADSENGYK